MKRILVFGLLTFVGLTACTKSEPPPPPKVEDTVFGDMVGTKERARVQTDQAVQEHKKQMEEAMKKSEGAE